MSVDDESCAAGCRDGASSLIADIGVQFTEFTETTMDDLLGFFRTLTGDPELAWPEMPVDWRAMFVRYAELIEERGGIAELEGSLWTPEQRAAICELPGWIGETARLRRER